ncbi:MAG: DUF4270 family protein, partial [Prolixibacteraceae bacterium]
SLIYVQATGGLKARVFIDNFSEWRDSVLIRNNDTIPYALNKAELVLQIDTLASEVEKYPPPNQLLITLNNEEDLPDRNNVFYYPEFYGGSLNLKDYTYRFNITKHLQQFVDGTIPNRGFTISTIPLLSPASRTILKGSESETGIKLIVTYTKFLQ